MSYLRPHLAVGVDDQIEEDIIGDRPYRLDGLQGGGVDHPEASAVRVVSPQGHVPQHRQYLYAPFSAVKEASTSVVLIMTTASFLIWRVQCVYVNVYNYIR